MNSKIKFIIDMLPDEQDFKALNSINEHLCVQCEKKFYKGNWYI